MRTTFSQLLASFLIACATGALAQASTPADSIPMTAGEVRKVDFETKKITLRHEEIKNLGMPQMTMVFRVSDPALLERVKAGDKVRFTAEKVNGAFTLTSIEAVP
jgi:Cu/Ag efflux protein CusF